MHAVAELPLDDMVAAACLDVKRADERRLCIAARHGDRDSMQAIYEAEAPVLLRRLRHLSGDLGRAQDLMHDAFVVAFSGRAPFDGNACLSTWLYGIALNKWRNEARKSKRRRALLAAQPGIADRSQDQAASETVVVDELQRQFDAALARLSAPLREAFVLRVLEALPLREAALLAGVAQPTMSKRARKAEAQVRAALEADLGPPQEPR